MSDQEFAPVEDAGDDASFSYAAKKRLIVILLLAYSAILGIVLCFLPEEDTPIDFVVGLPLLILGVSWCFTDAAERGHRIGRLMRLFLILVFIVGLPTYFLQTRGFGAFKTLALTFLLIVAMFTL
jgi:hypothetical protein